MDISIYGREIAYIALRECKKPARVISIKSMDGERWVMPFGSPPKKLAPCNGN